MQNSSFRCAVACLSGALLLLLSACVDPITVGSELLGGDRATIGYNAEVSIDLYTFQEDSIKVFDGNSRVKINTIHFGSLEEDVFGRSERAVHFFPELPRNTASGLIIRPPFVNVDTISIDSIVLVIPIDTNFFYGNAIGQEFAYTGQEILETFDLTRDYFSNSSFQLAAQPIASASVRPLKAATLLHDTLVVDSILTPHVRIRLNGDLAQRFLAADTSIYNSDAQLRDFFGGVFLQASSAGEGLFAINATSGFAGFYFYLSTSNRNPTFYLLPLETTVPNYRFNRAGSLAAERIAQSVNNQQGLVEGAGGLTCVVEVSNLAELQGKVINQAELEFYLDELPDYSYSLFPPANSVSLYFRNRNGLLDPIDDFAALSPNPGQEAIDFFLGGRLTTDAENGRQKYTANVTVHLQRIIDGDYDPSIYIRVNPPLQTSSGIFGNRDAGRSILLGPAHPDFPMRLKVAFTE